MASQLQKQIYQAYMNAGLSPNQARIITAEVGRENSFNPQTVFGVHSDPKNKALNLGMLSWQGDRGRSLYSYLHSKGLIQNGSILKNQASLDEMARFSVSEMKNNKGYAQTAKTFLSNPDVDYQTGVEVLGKNYIRWRYDDPNYSSGHANRDHFYRSMGGVTNGSLNNNYEDPYEYVDLKAANSSSDDPYEYVQQEAIGQPNINQYEYVNDNALASTGNQGNPDLYEYVPDSEI